jgi:hypothetical protein
VVLITAVLGGLDRLEPGRSPPDNLPEDIQAVRFRLRDYDALRHIVIGSALEGLVAPHPAWGEALRLLAREKRAGNLKQNCPSKRCQTSLPDLKKEARD